MKISTIVIVVSFVWLIAAFWNRNDLPRNVEFRSEVLAEPRQTKTRTGPFEAVFNGVDYLVEPEYEYDLAGMVVSYRHHDGNSRMHFLANDHLNMLDVCVVWGDSATSKRLHKIDFWNGIFTCNVFTRDSAAWAAFSMDQLSNNHLISDDETIRKQVKKIAIGDQIRVRGYLASYISEKGGKRGTSTTRTDTGNGACETLFVERFEIIQPAMSYWRISTWVSSAFLAFGLFIHFRRPYRPY
ncbi:MAG: hypothetical protein KJO01_00590 [Gammaproteobacteria bacterium]|nr:hypothetical protein [Gammaproteobacteria bacterium]MBT8109254.1 hypothetical protein [Gammaproteobacteria bacterium]NND47284.1 hypothetical protein [Woeseiaceae bacterium]NNL43956.1 hypothetical protein [Woeseiaceae bacterium]